MAAGQLPALWKQGQMPDEGNHVACGSCIRMTIHSRLGSAAAYAAYSF